MARGPVDQLEEGVVLHAPLELRLGLFVVLVRTLEDLVGGVLAVLLVVLVVVLVVVAGASWS